MGGFTSTARKFWQKPWSQGAVRTKFIGLDGAGKTTILYQLKQGKVVNTIPTKGFNLETIEYGNVRYQIWDVGINSQTRPLLRHYYAQTIAVVFVIDCHDKDRYREAVDELLDDVVKADELKGFPILVLDNKQDLAGAMSRDEIVGDLIYKSGLTGRKWEVFPVSGLKGEGLREGLDWLTGVLTGEPRVLLS